MQMHLYIYTSLCLSRFSLSLLSLPDQEGDVTSTSFSRRSLSSVLTDSDGSFSFLISFFPLFLPVFLSFFPFLLASCPSLFFFLFFFLARLGAGEGGLLSSREAARALAGEVGDQGGLADLPGGARTFRGSRDKRTLGRSPWSSIEKKVLSPQTHIESDTCIVLLVVAFTEQSSGVVSST